MPIRKSSNNCWKVDISWITQTCLSHWNNSNSVALVQHKNSREINSKTRFYNINIELQYRAKEIARMAWKYTFSFTLFAVTLIWLRSVFEAFNKSNSAFQRTVGLWGWSIHQFKCSTSWPQMAGFIKCNWNILFVFDLWWSIENHFHMITVLSGSSPTVLFWQIRNQ